MIDLKKLIKKYPDITFEESEDLDAFGTINGTEYKNINDFLTANKTKIIKY